MKFLKIKLTHCPKLTHSPKIDTIAPNLTQCHRIQESILKIIILVANFKLMVLRAQIELGVQIFVLPSFRLIFFIFWKFWSQYSRIVNNVNWFESENPWRIPKMMILLENSIFFGKIENFENFGMSGMCQLQIDCSLSSDRGVLKALRLYKIH